MILTFLTHPPYQQSSSFPIPTLNMKSSFPHTHPPIDIFFSLSLINKAKIRQGLFFLKKTYILHTNSGSFFQPFFLCTQTKFFFLVYFLLTSAFNHPTHPPWHQTSSFGHPTHPPLWWPNTWMVPNWMKSDISHEYIELYEYMTWMRRWDQITQPFKKEFAVIEWSQS